MSDYLGHLATRATATAANIRPRSLSRFEPAPAPASSAMSVDPQRPFASTDQSATPSNTQHFFGANPPAVTAGFHAIADSPAAANGGVQGRRTHPLGDATGSHSALLDEWRSWNDVAAAGRGRAYEIGGLRSDADDAAAASTVGAGPSASHGLAAAHRAAFDADGHPTGLRRSRRRSARSGRGVDERRLDALATTSDRIDGDAASASSVASRSHSAGDTQSDADRSAGPGHELAIGGARAGLIARVRARRARDLHARGPVADGVDASVASVESADGSRWHSSQAPRAISTASQRGTPGLSSPASIGSIASSIAARDAGQSASHARRSSSSSHRASSFDSGSLDAARDIVHVTIGRVEVRASVPPPAPAPRSAPREAAALTLDQYLRQRAGGGAR